MFRQPAVLSPGRPDCSTWQENCRVSAARRQLRGTIVVEKRQLAQQQRAMSTARRVAETCICTRRDVSDPQTGDFEQPAVPL